MKDEIESCVAQLLSKSKTTTFKSIQLSEDIAELAEKHLKYIAHKNRCCIINELRCKSQCYTIPKSLSSNLQVLQSDDFLSSPDIFKKIDVANGSIEIRTDDIGLQKVSLKVTDILLLLYFLQVDAIIISTTTNGLKEGVIERAGTFDYERTYTNVRGPTFTETNGGKLICKRILFSNWMPRGLTNEDNDLRKSIQIFISKSIEYATKERSTRSIAFAVSDSCRNERILAQEMIASVKQQLQSKNLQLKISFILLPEQQNLHSQFFTLMGETQDIYALFDWPTSGKTHITKVSNVPALRSSYQDHAYSVHR